MPVKVISTPFDAITYKIIGCAMGIHRELGPGLKEKTYQKALEVSISNTSLSYEAQKFYPVYAPSDHEQLIGYYIPDLVVEDCVVVEIKALNKIDNSHLAQVIGYLAISGIPVGLLINFGERSLRYRRVFPPQKVIDHLVNHQWLFVPEWLQRQKTE